MPDENKKLNLQKIALLSEMLQTAESSLRQARTVLSEVLGKAGGEELLNSKLQSVSAPKLSDDGDRVIEGIFDGEKMIGPDEKTFPIPANYASKSKLVTGDQLKLTIGSDGRFLFKQIGPVQRKHLVGPLTFEDGQYKVIADGKAFKVLLASVTFFRADVGDEITILVPEDADCEWAAIEAVLPKIENKENKKMAEEIANENSSEDFDF